MKVIVVPDVHGRVLWKKAKEYSCPVIFLGDYLDPYVDYDNITQEESIKNFKEILEYARNNSNVHLLLGNHDMTYVIGRNICHCRALEVYYNEVRKLFIDNIDIFSLAHREVINDKLYLFTHAGISKFWCDIHKDVFNHSYEEVLRDYDFSTSCLSDKDFVSTLRDVSYWRGGYEDTGSMIWIDVREWPIMEPEVKDVVQVFGHTYSNHERHFNSFTECHMLDDGKTIDGIEEDGSILII